MNGTVMDAADLLEVVGKIIREKHELLTAKMDAMELQPGPVGAAGKDASPQDVANLLLADKAFIESLQGRPGTPGMGIKAVEVEPDCSAFHLVFDNDESAQIELPKGADGKSADPVDVAKALRSDSAFMLSVKGENGVGIERAKLDPETNIFSIHYTNGQQHDFVIPKAKDGKPGKDAHPKDVAEQLKADPPFLKLVKGDKGDPGQDGKPGKDGKDGERGPVGDGILNKQWIPGTVYRIDERVTHNLGQVFKALADTVEEPGYSLQWQRIGLIGFRFLKRKPKLETDLADGDIYPDGGSLFLFSNGKAHLFLKRPRDADNLGIAKHLIESHDFGKALVEALTQCEQFTDQVAAKAPGPEITAFYLQDLKNLVIEFKNAPPAVADVSALTLELIRIFKMDQAPPDEYATPVRWFRGRYSTAMEYSVGDVVKDGRKTYIAVEQPIRGQLGKPQWADFGGTSASSSAAVSQNAITAAVEKATSNLGLLTWENAYQPGEFTKKNTVVNDGGWLMVANTDTTDQAAPVTVGDIKYYGENLPVDETGWTKITENLNFLIAGTQYKIPFHFAVSHIAVYIPDISSNLRYDIYVAREREWGVEVNSVVDNYPAQQIGWHSIPMGNKVFEGGQTIDLILKITSTAGSSQASSQWTYVRSANMPTAGQVTHQKNSDHLYMSQKDGNGVDQKTLLDSLAPGATITAGPAVWEVTEIDFTPGGDNDGVYDFVISPTTSLNTNTLYTFLFTIYTASSIPIHYEPDYYLSDSQALGIIRRDNNAVVYDENGYGVDFQYQEVIKSPDWDIMSPIDVVTPSTTANRAAFMSAAATAFAFQMENQFTPGANLLNEFLAMPADGQKATFDLMCWNDAMDFRPVLAAFDSDKTTPADQTAAQLINLGGHNFTLGTIYLWDASAIMQSGSPEFFLSNQPVKQGTKVLSTFEVDRRDPDFDAFKITSQFISDMNEQHQIVCAFTVAKADTAAYFQFGQFTLEPGVEWRAFIQ